MYAFGPGQPLMTDKIATLRPAQAFSAKDEFQAVLQGRLVAHLQRGMSMAPVSGASKAEVVPGGAAGSGQTAADGLSGRQPHQLERRLPPERLPEVAAVLLLAGFPAEPLQALLTDPRVQQQGLSLRELRQAYLQAQVRGSRDQNSGTGAGAVTRALLPKDSVPPVLAALLDLVAQSPDGVMPVPSSRQPEIAALLQEAGFSSKQVETLLTSPQVQESGLTVEILQAAWLKSVQGQQTGPAENSLNGAAPPVTSRADYQRLWERLRLPAKAFPDLRLALQQLGATPEALAALEEHANPQGLPLGQIWQVIKQCLTEAQAANQGPNNPAEPATPPSGAEVEQWRQLLLQAGLSAEAVEGLLGVQSPASAAELRERLAALAPSTSPPKVADAPKPLYLPASLRLRALSWDSPSDSDSGLGKQQGETETPTERGEFLAAQTQPRESLEGFSTWLAPSAAALSTSGLDMGGSPLTLTPEIRQAFWSQLEAGILGNLQPGETRLNLSLDPPHLGIIELTLNLRGEDLVVTAVINRPEVAYLASAGLEQLVQALSQHGLILSQFQVRQREGLVEPTGLAVAGAKTMGRKGSAAEGGESGRRRGSGRVDRFA